MHVRAVTLCGGAVLTISLASCAQDVKNTADHYASVTATTITQYVTDHVAKPGRSPALQIAAVRRWLQDPTPDFTEANTYPDVQVLKTSTNQRIDMAVYESAEGHVLEGSGSARGVACVRYTVDAASRLHAAPLTCPSGT